MYVVEPLDPKWTTVLSGDWHMDTLLLHTQNIALYFFKALSLFWTATNFITI